MDNYDTITCHDKQDAKKYGDAIGWANVQSWEILKDGRVILYVSPIKEVINGSTEA